MADFVSVRVTVSAPVRVACAALNVRASLSDTVMPVAPDFVRIDRVLSSLVWILAAVSEMVMAPVVVMGRLIFAAWSALSARAPPPVTVMAVAPLVFRSASACPDNFRILVAVSMSVKLCPASKERCASLMDLNCVALSDQDESEMAIWKIPAAERAANSASEWFRILAAVSLR